MLRKKGERRKMFLKSTYSFFLFFLLWSGSGTCRKVVSALSSRADVTSRLITVSIFFLWSLLFSLLRFTEIPSFCLSPPAPNSSLHNSSHFWRDRFLLATLIFIIFFFFLFISNRMGAWSRCVATSLYTLYVIADESTSGWEFYFLFLNPHILTTSKNMFGSRSFLLYITLVIYFWFTTLLASLAPGSG